MDNNYNQYLICDFKLKENFLNNVGTINLNSSGSPQIVNTSNLPDKNGDKIFNTACYFNGNSYLISKDTFSLFGKDTTIELWYYLAYKDRNIAKGGGNEQVIFSIMNNNDYERCVYYYSIYYNYFRFSIKGMEDFNITNTFDYWNYLVYCYKHNTSKWYIYLNGELKYTHSESRSRNNYYLSLGTQQLFTNRLYCGYIRNFKIYDGICKYNGENFTYNSLLYNEEINNSYNTKRLFFFNYNLNTIRKTKWNNKVNYYVMDPSIYNKK